jgi:hypothetical protein
MLVETQKTLNYEKKICKRLKEKSPYKKLTTLKRRAAAGFGAAFLDGSTEFLAAKTFGGAGAAAVEIVVSRTTPETCGNRSRDRLSLSLFIISEFLTL